MTVLTGETGAGKTLVVEALQLVLGGRASPAWCGPGRPRPSSRPASWSGEGGAEEVILARSVPAEAGPAPGSTAAWRRWPRSPRPAAELAEIHGQHEHRVAGHSAPAHAPSWTRSPAPTSAGCERCAASCARSTRRWRARAATRSSGPARPTSCATRWRRSTPPASTDPDEEDACAARRTGWPTPPPIARRRSAPRT